MTLRTILNLDTHPQIAITDGTYSARVLRDEEESTVILSNDRADFSYDYRTISRLLDVPIEGMKIHGEEILLTVAYELDPWWEE